ncbi:MAG TPA: DUF6644 family protein [Gammaproteobacteria bacterium]|nr:DUF6644 family protein [Gammaproteobacteria bacterium]
MLAFFEWLQYSPPLVAMRSSPWLFPMIASVHLLGLAMLGGAVLVVDLRLLGLGLTRQPAAVIGRAAEPWLVASLLVMLPTGLLLFMCFATKYYYLAAFWVKVAGVLLALTLTFSVRRRLVLAADADASAVARKLVASASLLLWATVALAGRVIGFP